MTIHLERDLLLLKRRLLEASTLAEQAIHHTRQVAVRDHQLARDLRHGLRLTGAFEGGKPRGVRATT